MKKARQIVRSIKTLLLVWGMILGTVVGMSQPLSFLSCNVFPILENDLKVSWLEKHLKAGELEFDTWLILRQANSPLANTQEGYEAFLKALRGNEELLKFFSEDVKRVRAWEVLRETIRSTDLAWLQQMNTWLGLNVTYSKAKGVVIFTAPNGMEFARLDGNDLYYVYPGFGGDIRVRPDRVTTVLGKFQEEFGDPSSFGTWVYLTRNKGLQDGIISRVVASSPPNNTIAFLDLPEDQYFVLVNSSIRDQILLNPLFDGNISNLDLVSTQNPWGDEIRNVIETKILPKATSDEIKAILKSGQDIGKEVFWEKYNLEFLEAAFKRGDDIRLVSDPAYRFDLVNGGFYKRELDAIMGSDGLAKKHGYIYDSSINTFIKK